MTKDKWLEVVEKETNEFHHEMELEEEASPETWPNIKKILTDMIKNIDEVTEVYNRENRGEQNGQ